MHTATIEDVAQVCMEVRDCQATSECAMHGMVVWFDVGFGEACSRPSLYSAPEQCVHYARWADWFSQHCTSGNVVISTSPWAPTTHWRHALLMFDEPMALTLSSPGSVQVGFQMTKNEHLPRHYKVELGVRVASTESKGEQVEHKYFALWR
jgi:hypothetical protein